MCRSQWVLICWVRHPRQVAADADPQVVVAAGGDRPPVGVAQQLPVGGARRVAGRAAAGGPSAWGRPAASGRSRPSPAAGSGTGRGRGRPGRSARAPPRRQAVSVCSRSSSVSRAGSLPVVAATWLISASRVSGTARRVDGSRRGLATLRAGLSAVGDVAVVLGVAVQAAQRGDEVFGRAASAAGVAARHDVGLDVFGELLDLRRGRLVQASGAPVLDDPVPVRAVHPAGAVADGRAARPGRTRRTSAPAAGRCGAAARSAGETPIRASSSSAASTTACWDVAGCAAVHGHGRPLAGVRKRRAARMAWSTTAKRVGGQRVLGRGRRPAAPGHRCAGRSGGAARRGSRCRRRSGTVTMPPGSRRAIITPGVRGQGQPVTRRASPARRVSPRSATRPEASIGRYP